MIKDNVGLLLGFASKHPLYLWVNLFILKEKCKWIERVLESDTSKWFQIDTSSVGKKV